MRFLLVCFLSIPFLLQAQQPDKIICKHLNNRNGLMYGDINGLVQDKNGYIWFAGEEGLQRYDGYEFVNYFHNPNKPEATFPKGRLMRLGIDSKNRLWINSFSDGFGWYNAFTNTNKHYTPHNQKLLTSNAVGFRDFLFANDSVTYLCGNNGIVKLMNDEIVKTFTPENSALQGGLTGNIAKDKNGNFWIGTVNGLNFLSANEQHIYNHTNNTVIAAFANNVLKDNVGNKAAIAKLFIDHKNNLWISTWRPELYRYNIDKNILETIVLPEKKSYEYDNLVYDIIEDNEHNIWIGTSNNGLYKYSYTNNSFTHFLHNINDAQSIGTNSILKLMKDRDGNIWLTGRNIISTFNPSYKLIQPMLPNAAHAVSAVMVAADKTLWAADVEWLYHFNEQQVFINKYRHQYINEKKKNSGIWGLKESRNGKEIFIEKENGLAIFNKQTKAVDDFKELLVLKTNPVTDIIETNNGNLYLLRWWWEKNLIFLDRNKRTVTPVQLPIEDKNNFEIAHAIQKNDTVYYLFSKRGLMLLQTNSQQVKMLDADYSAGSSILVNNKFYAATASTGIIKYDVATQKISSIGKFEGFPVNNTKNIVYAGNDEFWIATSSGLIKWKESKNIFTTFSEDEGLAQPSVYGNSLVVTGNGKIVFSNGNLLMLETQLIKQQQPPTVIITSCMAGDSLLSPAQLNNNIKISYANNVVQVRFAAINYPSRNIKYEYMLQGYDKEWKDGSLRFVNYTNLPHGNYIFKVRAANDEGVWSNETTQLQFYVTQAFYKAWWFYALLGAVLLFALLFYYRIRINRILELQKLRNNISRDLHDEVGSTLSGISILSTSVINNLDQQPLKTKEWVQQIGKDAQNMLNVMDDIVWSINPKMDSFENIVSRMKETAYHVAEAADIKIQFNDDEGLNNISLPMLTKKNLYLIFKETINNAVKHAACNNIFITLKKQNKKLVLTIADDGKGFDTNNEVNRNGLKNIKQRAAEINATITCKSKLQQGSIIELTISL